MCSECLLSVTSRSRSIRPALYTTLKILVLFKEAVGNCWNILNAVTLGGHRYHSQQPDSFVSSEWSQNVQQKLVWSQKVSRQYTIVLPTSAQEGAHRYREIRSRSNVNMHKKERHKYDTNSLFGCKSRDYSIWLFGWLWRYLRPQIALNCPRNFRPPPSISVSSVYLSWS